MNRKTTILSLKCLLVLFCGQALNAQQIYSNGGLSTGVTANDGTSAPSGYTWSECQNDTGVTTESNGTAGFGALFNTAGTNSLQLADDFIVPVGQIWDVTSFDFFGYKTGYAGATIPMDQLRIQIFNVDPSTAGATALFGNMTTSVLDAANSGDANMYRIFNSAVPNTVNVPGTTRKIWRYRGNITASLTAGTYWVVFQMHDAADTAAFMPAVTIAGSRGLATFNAKQNTVAGTTPGWISLVDGGAPATAPDVAQDMPFRINGTVTLGVNQYDLASAISIYPNPAGSFISIANSSDAIISAIEIVDLNGRIVKKVNTALVEKITISDLSSGSYFVTISFDKGSVTKKFIKK